MGMGDVYRVNHNGIRHNTTTMMSGGFAAFSFGIFFEGMNINLPGNVLVAGSRVLYNSCPVDQCILGWVEITKQTRGAKFSPVSLSKPEWYCLMVMVRLKMINHPTPSLEDGRSQEVCA